MTLGKIWEEHTRDEFVARDVERMLATTADDAYVNHIPVMTGGFGKKKELTREARNTPTSVAAGRNQPCPLSSRWPMIGRSK